MWGNAAVGGIARMDDSTRNYRLRPGYLIFNIFPVHSTIDCIASYSLLRLLIEVIPTCPSEAFSRI